MPDKAEVARRLTADEKQAIQKLKALADSWPESLWLFSASGTLCVMQKNEDGEQAFRPWLEGGVDPTYCVATIEIENDGGDW